MLSIEERLRRANERLERQDRQDRIARRQEREAKKKAQQRRNYAVGELVMKYIPQLKQVESLEDFFSKAASDPEAMKTIENLLVKITPKVEEEVPTCKWTDQGDCKRRAQKEDDYFGKLPPRSE